MKDSFIFILLFVCVLNTNGFGLKQNYTSDNYIVVYDSIYVSKIKKDKQVKEKLRRKILEDISYQIITSVHFETKEKVIEKKSNNNSTIESEFNIYTEIKSNLDITNLQEENYWYDKKTKYFKGVIVVDKKKLSETSLSNSCNKIQNLILELENIKYHKQTGDLKLIESEYKKQEIWFFICLSISPRYDGVIRFRTLTDKYNTLFFEIKRSNQEVLVQQYLSEINVLKSNRKYPEALILFKKCLLDFPYLVQLNETKHSIEQEYESFLLEQISVYKEFNQFEEALEKIDHFLNLSYSKEIMEQKIDIEKKLFNQYLKNFYLELKSKNIDKASDYLYGLEKMKSIDLYNFIQAEKDFNRLVNEKNYENIHIYYKDKRYEQTWELIKQYESSSSDKKDISYLKEKTRKKLYNIEKRKYLSNASPKYSILLGVDGNSSNYFYKYFLDSVGNSSYHISYSLTLSRILNKESFFNYIGVQFRYLNNKRSNNLLIGTNIIFLESLFFDFNIPVNPNKIEPINNYHFSSGLVIPYNRVFLKLGVQTTTDFKTDPSLQAYFSFKYQFRFGKSLSNNDKKLLENRFL
jgi:hypothetical protein